MQFSYFYFGGAAVHYLKTGQGTKILLAFHGVGQDHTCYNTFTESLGDQYTFYVFDLFYHGKTAGINANQPNPQDRLSKVFWGDFMQAFCAENQIDKFSVAGFSMGGKFVLATTEALAGRIETLYLLAPDGIGESIWYRLATRFWPTQWLFKLIVFNPLFARQIGNVFLQLGWVNKSTLRFIDSTLATPQQQMRVYLAWLVFSDLRFDMSHLGQLCNQNGIRVRLFLGRYDALVPEASVYALTTQLNDYELVMLKTGHHRLVEKAAEWLQSSQNH